MPVRTCVGCRKKAQRGQLLRVVVSGGRGQLDVKACLPGRGLWLHPQMQCFLKAQKKNLFGSMLRQKDADFSSLLSQFQEQLELS